MSSSFDGSHNKLCIGYHWNDDCGQRGGIPRYVTSIIKSGNNAKFRFVNLFSSARFSFPIMKRLFFFLDLFFFGFMPQNRNIDIYWGPAHKLPLIRIKGVSYVVTIHDLVWKTCPKTMPLLRRFTERFFFPIAIRNADVILAVSHSTADDLVKYFPRCADKIKVVPLAKMLPKVQDFSNLNKHDKHSQKYILFVGTIEPRKNIKNILKAYARLSKKLKEKYKFYLIGGAGWGDIHIDALILKLDLNRYVEWKYSVTDHELIGLYQYAYCLLFPSLYEGFGLPIIEAQSFGVPVITSNISSMPEVVGDGGLLVAPDSVDSIQNALESLLVNSKLRGLLSQKAQANSERFSWEKTRQATNFAFTESIHKVNKFSH